MRVVVAAIVVTVAFATVAGLTLGAQTPDATVWNGVYSEAQAAAYTPEPHSGHKVDARGFLIRRPAGNRINITGLETVASDCSR